MVNTNKKFVFRCSLICINILLIFADTIQTIITACAVLHNIAIAGDEPMPALNNEIEPFRCVSNRTAVPPVQRMRGSSSRDRFILEHFSND